MRNPSPLRVTCRRGRERGAAIAELAIVFPVFALFLFGALDFGINWQHRLQTVHSAREVARAATVARMGEDTSCTPVGIASPSQLLHEAICLAKQKAGRDPADVRVKLMYMGPGGRESTNPDNPKNSVIVCVMSAARSSTLIMAPFFNGRFYTARAVAKTAKPSGGIPVPPGQETALSGASWAFCEPDQPEGTEA